MAELDGAGYRKLDDNLYDLKEEFCRLFSNGETSYD